jgi:SAM-dependent methyltransferase
MPVEWFSTRLVPYDTLPCAMDAALRTESATHCALCGRSGGVLHANLRDRLSGVDGTWDIRRCPDSRCGLAWLDPRPLESDLSALYADYFTHAPTPERPRTWRRLVPPVTAVSGWCFHWTPLRRTRRRAATMYLDNVTPGRLLDVGCGSGELLAHLRALGWDVVGQEVDAVAAQVAAERHGVTVRVGPIGEIDLPTGAFDAITISHVLEHVPDPVALLRTCYTLAKPGGAIVCVTPNLDSWGHQRFGDCWIGLDPPRHLHLFSPVSLISVARLAGLTEASVWTSAANAEFISAGSLDLRWQGFHRIGSGGRPHRAAAAALLQLAASARHLVDHGSGDECVLYATV